MKKHCLIALSIALCGVMAASCSKSNPDKANTQADTTVQAQNEAPAADAKDAGEAPAQDAKDGAAPNDMGPGGMMPPPPFEMNSYKREILEICDNGKDDDNDGKADCDDPKCIQNVSCIATAMPTVDESACIDINLADPKSDKLDINKDDEKHAITIKVSADAKTCLRLKGAYDGRVDIKSVNDKDIDVILDNVSITSNNAAGTLKLNTANKEKGNHFVIKLVGDNKIEGGATKDSNKVLSSDANVDIIGDGKLTVVSKYKSAIAVDDVLHIWSGSVDAKIERSGEVTDKATVVKATNGYIQSGGDVVITGRDNITNYEARGLKVDGSETAYGAGKGGIIISGGTLTVETDGKAISAGWSLSEDAKTEDTNDDPYPDVTITGGKISVHTYTTPRESRRMGMPPGMDKEKFKEQLLKMDTQFMPPEFREMAEKVKNGEDPFAAAENDKTEDNSISPEGIEAKGHMFIKGGEIISLATDDAIGAGGSLYISGGNIYAYSTDNDGIDANNRIEVSGGTIVAFGSDTPECGFDADFETNVSYTGGTVVAVGGHNTAPGTISADTSFIQLDLVESSMKRPGGPGMGGPGGFRGPGMGRPERPEGFPGMGRPDGAPEGGPGMGRPERPEGRPGMGPGGPGMGHGGPGMGPGGPGMGPGHREKTTSKLAGKTIAVTLKGSDAAVAAVKVPEGFTGGGNVIVMSSKITKDSDYQVYADATLTGATSWFNDALLLSDATAAGADPKETKGGVQTENFMANIGKGGPMGDHNKPENAKDAPAPAADANNK